MLGKRRPNLQKEHESVSLPNPLHALNSASRPQGRNAQSFAPDPDPMGHMELKGAVSRRTILSRQRSQHYGNSCAFFSPSDRNCF